MQTSLLYIQWVTYVAESAKTGLIAIIADLIFYDKQEC